MIAAIDTNILLDILIPNVKYAKSSKAVIDDAFRNGSLVISEIVYAELSSQFPAKNELDHLSLATFPTGASFSLSAKIVQYLPDLT